MMMRTPYEGCPLCGGREVKSTLVADCSKHPRYKPVISPVMTWLECAACEHVYTDGYHTKEALEIIYGSTPPDSQKVGFDPAKHRLFSARMIEKVLPHTAEGHWLDIGFGNGSLLLTAEEYGFLPVGIDLRKDNVEALRDLGVEAHSIDLAEFIQPSRFRVVSMCDVLEHMPYPGASLKLVHALLDSNGMLFLSMPNMDSFLWRILNTSHVNPYWSELEHYHNFGKQRLYRLLRDHGFEPIRYGISERYRVCMEIIAQKMD